MITVDEKNIEIAKMLGWVGRVYTKYNCKKVELELQDDDKTLKIFISNE